MSPPNTPRIPTLFFDERGCGPDACDFALHPMKPLLDGEKVIAARSVGLRVFASQEGIGAFMFATAGGYQLFEEQARELRDQLSAWLDAPRLEARKNPTVVHVDEKEHFCLLTTSAGEWCTAEHYGGPDPETVLWFATEGEARDAFTECTGMGWCSNDWCKAYVAANSLDEDGEDGPEVCPSCYQTSLDAWNQADVHHVQPSDCPWKGKGADVVYVDNESLPYCPKCGEAVSDIDLADIERRHGDAAADHAESEDERERG